MVEYSRNPARFPINQYINIKKVDKQRGYFPRMKNDNQNRYINQQDAYWPDGNDAPRLLYGTDPFEFVQFNCIRYGYTKQLGYLSVDQGAWDVLGQASRLLAMDAMTFRSKRVHTTITTSGNYPSANVFNAVATGGATWANATSTTPSIRKCVMTAAIAVQKSTLSTVDFSDLYLVMNPNTAQTVACSAEFIDFLKQNPVALAAWQGTEQFTKYNIPPMLFGLNVVVDDTVYNSGVPGPSVSLSEAFSFPDNVAVLLSKQNAIKPAAGPAFSTFTLYAYEDFETFVYNDPKDRRYDLQVVENVDDSFITAKEAGALINTNS